MFRRFRDEKGWWIHRGSVRPGENIFRMVEKGGLGLSGRVFFQGKTCFMLWMDEIHFAPPKKPWNGLIPLKIPANSGFPWFQSGANGFRPSTVGWKKVVWGLGGFPTFPRLPAVGDAGC